MRLQRWPKVEDLRRKLNGRAKADPTYRFYSLYDKVYRQDVLEAAYAHCRANHGKPGVDGVRFEDIEASGVDAYLDGLAKELKERKYRPAAIRRVMIPKDQPGKFRPLGIPTIRDRIVQQAVKLLLEPIFEADLTDQAYGYREGRSALDAVVAVDTGLRQGFVNVVDGDLSGYFDTIPHDQLIASVERRIADHAILWLIRWWLKAPIEETTERGKTRIVGGKKTKCGTPQGSVISPLLANIYFRRFLLAWERFGLARRFGTRIVNYADDFVILCCSRQTQEARRAAQQLFELLGLRLNPDKTRVVRAWQDSFDFLGYTFGIQYGNRGEESLGKRPSHKKIQAYRHRVRDLTSPTKLNQSASQVKAALNAVTRGFWGYFKLGRVNETRHKLDSFIGQRLFGWLKKKYPKSRGRRKKTGQAGRWGKIREGLRGLVRSKHLRPWCDEGLFKAAAYSAQ